MKAKLGLICGCLMLVGSAAYGITILSVSGANGSQPNGGVLKLATLNNIYTDLANIGTVLGGATGAPTGSGSVVLSTNPTINGGSFTGTPTGLTQSVVVPLTLTQLQTLHSVGVQILPAPGATSMYVMGPCVLNLTYGSAAFTGGGTVSIGYGTQASVTASNSTIASTVFTTFSASHLVVVEPTAQAVTATTTYANTAIFAIAASADFAAGTGGSGQISCQYSTVTGVS